jgi:CheY-like chemotaxis protein
MKVPIISRIYFWLKGLFTPSAAAAERKKASDLAAGGAMTLLIGTVGVGILIVVLHAAGGAAGASGPGWPSAVQPMRFLSILGAGLMTAGGAFLSGLLAGFLFGIPRSGNTENEQGKNGATATVLYKPNANLEQISDWLTKILVGVGLTQLTRLPGFLHKTAAALAPGLGGSQASVVLAATLLVYFSLAGFLMGYLWTRLKLTGLLTLAEEAIQQAKKEGSAEGQKKFMETETITPSTPASANPGTQGAAATTLPAATAPQPGQQSLRVLWVDDRQDNNASERAYLTGKFGLSFDAALSTNEALKVLDENKDDPFRLIISDMGRPEGRHAGFDLLAKVRQKGWKGPFIVYSSYLDPEMDAQLKDSGSLGSAHDPNGLVRLVKQALAMP